MAAMLQQSMSSGWGLYSLRNAGAMQSPCNACKVSVTREEIAVVFGSRQGHNAGDADVPVRANTRVIMSPFTAKRLLAALVKSLREYEATYGLLSKATAPDDRIVSQPVLHPPAFRLPLSTQKAVQLIELIDQLGTGAQFERSFKLMDRTLLANRILLAIEKQGFEQGLEARTLDFCERLGMSQAGLRMFAEHLPEADVVGFGLEEDDTTCMVKAYLEFRHRYAEARQERRDKDYSYISHMGVKWDAADRARSALARYVCFPALTAEDMLDRVAGGHYRSGDGGPLAVVQGIIELAANKVGGDRFLYLEATEEHTPRASFDINVYAANLRMQQVSHLLSGAFRHYAIPEAALHELYETMKDGTLGHLAGGTDRRGRDFLTVYFEE